MYLPQITTLNGHLRQIFSLHRLVGWLVVLGLTALLDSISVYIGPSPKDRDKEERKNRHMGCRFTINLLFLISLNQICDIA